ncbi:mechanosensitive ion channel [Planktothrix mougeotii LEGE 06226]|uniref:Mechanosensitive ion channel n=1 Tax=Planktothrix mougeotii LEGE 06226 TaxID=1828728 RepID=A0ABR9UD56_9CYAN|nr:mechanosensitive ion channel [Planktothrix mougeotii LEGE 06226]
MLRNNFSKIILLVLICLIYLFGFPASAQEQFQPLFQSNIAGVTLDGRAIFKVSGAENLTAQERAEMISTKLQQAAISTEPIEVKVKPINEQPTLWLNNSYLLTVTQEDTQKPNLPEDQAQIWRSEIQEAVKEARKERSLDFLKKATLKTILVLFFGGLFHWGLGWFWHHSLRRFFQLFIKSTPESSSSGNKPQNIELFLSLTLAGTRLGLWTAIILYLTNQFPFTRILSYRLTGTLISTLTSKLITINKASYSIPDLLILVSLVWGLIVFAKVITDLLQSRVLNATRISRGAQEVVAVIFRYGFISLGTIVLLQVWGLDLSSLTILASALGIGIGFGFQDIAKNFGSGLVLLFERPIQVGDFVEVGDYMGTVERIGARSTVIKTLDQVSIIVPNSRFLESELINWHHDNPISGLRLSVGVAYKSSVEIVKDLLLSAAKANSEVLSIPSPQVLFKGFGDNSLNFELRVWISKPSRQFIIKSDLYFQIESLFRQYKIEIPFPQRDVNIRGSVPLELSPELQTIIRQIAENKTNGYPQKLEGFGGQNSNP